MAAFDGTNGPVVKLQFYKGTTWTDVPVADIRSINIHRGRARSDQKMDAGNATIIFDNRSGVYDPDYLASSTWVVSGVSLLRDGLEMRIVATWASTAYVLFRGFLETTQVDHGFDPNTTMTFVDGIAVIAKVQVPSLKTASYSGELTKTRVGRMLTLAKWYPSNSAMKSLDGSIAMLATSQGTDAMSIIEECAAGQAGSFYVSRSGVATLLTLTDKFTRPTMLYFSDDRSANTVEYDSLVTTAGTKQVINQAVVKYNKTQQKTSTYNASVTKYGLKTVTVDAPIISSTTASHLATYYATKDSSPRTTVESITFSAIALGNLWDDFLAIELLDQLTVQRTTVDGRTLIMTLVLEGLDYNITPDTWDVTYSTSPINPKFVSI